MAGALAAAEVGVTPVVTPVVTVWIRVVRRLDGCLRREPARAELSGGLATGATDQRRRPAEDLRRHGPRLMTTLWTTEGPTRALAWTRRSGAVDATADPAGAWGRFAVELAGCEAALALVRRLGRGG